MEKLTVEIMITITLTFCLDKGWHSLLKYHNENDCRTQNEWVMYRKQIAYVAMVSMKFFFNLDHYIVDHIFLVAFLSIICFKIIITQFFQQILEQWHRAKGYLTALKEHLQHRHAIQEYSMLHVDRFKQHFPDKKHWGRINK